MVQDHRRVGEARLPENQRSDSRCGKNGSTPPPQQTTCGNMNGPFDLKARAHQAMLEAGFAPDFPASVAREAQALKQAAPKDGGAAVHDLRALLWSSIDNDSSRDLDQVEYVEKLADGASRLLIGIADVDSSVIKGAAIDGQAAAETTSVYTGVTTFPMLPG